MGAGVTFVVMSTLKIATMLGVGIGLTTAFQYFHSYEFKPKKKEKGVESDGKGDSIRERARSFS